MDLLFRIQIGNVATLRRRHSLRLAERYEFLTYGSKLRIYDVLLYCNHLDPENTFFWCKF